METQRLKPELIVMLTHQDRTVQDALQLFERTQDYPITHWGFKDVGLSPKEMQSVVTAMKTAGKNTFLEVVSLSEKRRIKWRASGSGPGLRRPDGNRVLSIHWRIPEGQSH